MKTTLGLMTILALLTTPVLAQKVNIDYAHEFDYDSIGSFQYVETPDSNAENSLMGDRIASLIRKELKEGGLQETDSNPDIYVTYHVTTQDQTNFSTSSYGYGGASWGGYYGWGGGGMGTSTTTTSTYTVGTLLIDAYDAAEKKMIWRGTGEVTVKSKPEKQIRQVESILAKIGKKWDKILDGQGK